MNREDGDRRWHPTFGPGLLYLYLAECARSIELRRLFDFKQREVEQLTEELRKAHSAAVQEQHLRDEIEALEVAVKVLGRDAATAQDIVRTVTALAETKLDALLEELRQRRTATSDAAARSAACRYYDPEHVGAYPLACRVCGMLREDHAPHAGALVAAVDAVLLWSKQTDWDALRGPSVMRLLKLLEAMRTARAAVDILGKPDMVRAEDEETVDHG